MKVRLAGVARRAAGWLAAPLPGTIMMEYAIVAAVIAIAAMAAVQAFGGGVAAVFQGLLGHLPHT
ncbi:MAG TPA: hypothetical protein VK009_18925 [Chloroflexota bacterium]|nr:hypothetical protein [Chloroflexota bacterium]